ncbi:Inactive hydroxysteroid dehydrogenase-like protein 1 [Nymphon striatum]|nr:Inactive hydroxysteroid dehydrogenase-like protein 1 [Nymphon striatum]
MLKVKYTDHVTNKKVKELIGAENIQWAEDLARRKLKFAGHVMRGCCDTLTQLVLEGLVEGKRDRGRHSLFEIFRKLIRNFRYLFHSTMYSVICFLGTAISLLFLYLVYKLWNLLYIHFIGHALGKTPNFKDFGKWCVVTGCTSGIGRMYAKAFAQKGLDMVLISRDPIKLDSLGKELQETYGVNIKIVVANFENATKQMYKSIRSEIQDLDIGILVNNVGKVQTISKFCDLQNADDEIFSIINTNITPHTLLSSMILPKMVKKDKGLVLFISSISALMPCQEFQLYGATKAYIDYLSRTLDMEYGSETIIIQSVVPGAVCSNIVRMEPSLITPSSEEYVQSQLKTVGLATRTVGYFWHNMHIIFMELAKYLSKKTLREAVGGNVAKMKETGFSYQFSK